MASPHKTTKNKTAGQKPARKSASPRSARAVTERLTDLVVDALSAAAETLPGADSEEFSLMPLNPIRVVVALSGGRDSMALLDIVEKLWRRPRQFQIGRVQAVYVNHGLSPNADEWETHCRSECEARRVPFTALRVTVRKTGDGVEAAAREARYVALARFARESESDIVMTAHHEDDRIETFLLQWLRGAGPEGLAAFPRTRALVIPGLAKAMHEKPLLLVRPWSTVLRTDIDRYAKSAKLKWVEDESNQSPKYLRNRVRNEVVPLLDKIRPGFREAAARAVSLTAEAAEVIRSVAQDDLAACRDQKDPHALRISSLLKLIPARQAWCLRAWMQAEGMQIPNRARLEEGLRQIRQCHADSMFTLTVRQKEMRRWGDLLVIRRAVPKTSADERDVQLVWMGRDDLELPGWRGYLAVIDCRPGEVGIPESRLKTGRLEVRARRGGERMKLWGNRPTKPLKDLFVEAGIPAFERDDHPLLWLDGELVYTGTLGMDVRLCPAATEEERFVRFEYRQVATLLDDQPTQPNLADRPAEARCKAK